MLKTKCLLFHAKSFLAEYASLLPIFLNADFYIRIELFVLLLKTLGVTSVVLAFRVVQIHAVVVHKLAFTHKLVSS